jgi:hypothetical protein
VIGLAVVVVVTLVVALSSPNGAIIDLRIVPRHTMTIYSLCFNHSSSSTTNRKKVIKHIATSVELATNGTVFCGKDLKQRLVLLVKTAISTKKSNRYYKEDRTS